MYLMIREFLHNIGLSLHNIRDRTWTIQACSAKEGEGLQEGLEWLVQNINTK